MRLSVRHIVELIGPNGAVWFGLVKLCREALGIPHKVVRIFIRRGGNLDQFCPGEAQHVFFLLGLRFGDHDHRAIAQRRTDNRKANPGIARRALDNRAPRPQRAACLGIPDHGQGRTILDRLARIHELGFAINIAAGDL